jgi:HlyD family secretion protein
MDAPSFIGGKGMKRWVILLIVIVVIVGGFLGFGVYQRRQAQAQQAGFETVVTERGKLLATIGATGSVRANQIGQVAFGTTGIVENVYVKLGDYVRKGEILVDLEQGSLSTQIILAEADLVAAEKALEELYDTEAAIARAQLTLAQAQDALEDAEYNWDVQQQGNRASGETIAATEANLVLAQREVDQAQDEYSKYSGRSEDDPVRALARSNLAAARQKRDSVLRNLNWYLGYPSETDQALLDADLEIARSNLREAEQALEELKSGPDPDDVAAAKARIAAAQANLDLAHIEAPFNGTITAVNIQPGDSVSPGLAVLQLADLSKMFVEVDISEVDLADVKVAQEVVINFDADLNQEYRGEIVELSLVGAVVQGVVNFKATVELLETDGIVRPGLTAAVNIITREVEDVLLVPNRAVRVREGMRIVYILKEGSLDPIEIELGASSDLFSEVIGGELQEGDLIVLNPPSNFFENGEGGGPFGGRGF